MKRREYPELPRCRGKDCGVELPLGYHLCRRCLGGSYVRAVTHATTRKGTPRV